MKLRTDIAQKVSESRSRIIKELALYVGDNATSLEAALHNASLRNECYMEHAPNTRDVSHAKYLGYKSGDLVVPAYIVQAALDSILLEGFQPDSLPMKKLMVGLLLTRRSMFHVEDIQRRFPQHWNKEYVDEIMKIAKGLL